MQKVKVTKLSTQIALHNSLYDGYWVEGVLVNEVEVGKPVTVWRHTRNGIAADGFLTTSRIKKIESISDNSSLVIETENSKYKIEYLDDVTQESGSHQKFQQT
jgi:hypothetical protein